MCIFIAVGPQGAKVVVPARSKTQRQSNCRIARIPSLSQQCSDHGTSDSAVSVREGWMFSNCACIIDAWTSTGMSFRLLKVIILCMSRETSPEVEEYAILHVVNDRTCNPVLHLAVLAGIHGLQTTICHQHSVNSRILALLMPFSNK